MKIIYFIYSVLIIVFLNAIEGSSGSGSIRRFLRSIAARSGGDIAQVQLPINSVSTLSETSGFVVNLKDLLSTRELVKIKTSMNKKKDVKAISGDIAKISDSEVVQVIGHTILLYRASGGEISKQLKKRQEIQSHNTQNTENEEM